MIAEIASGHGADDGRGVEEGENESAGYRRETDQTGVWGEKDRGKTVSEGFEHAG